MNLPIHNMLRDERLAAGFQTPEDFATRAGLDAALYRAMEEGAVLPRLGEFERVQAALGGIDADRLYLANQRQIIGLYAKPDADRLNLSEAFHTKRGPERLLIARDEITWLERGSMPTRPVDAFLNMSCSTQESPHLLLDTVAVCNALGISFVAAAGAAGCCGKPMMVAGNVEAGERWIDAKARRIQRMNATVQVNWCIACQSTTETSAARRPFEGREQPVSYVQLFEFLGDRIEDLGDRVPWKVGLNRRVVVEGHDWSLQHSRAWQMTVRLLALVPGVEVVSTYNGFESESPCGFRGRERSQGEWTAPITSADVIIRRAELATRIQAMGADTVACMHQACHLLWCRYSSDQLTVQHAVSIVAEALGCSHPDRFQAAVRIADPNEIVTQTQRNWESWGLARDEAVDLARTFLVDERHAAGVTQCACGDGACSEKLISVDVLRASARPR